MCSIARLASGEFLSCCVTDAYIVTQATDNSIPFYERMGFVRVGACTVKKRQAVAKDDAKKAKSSGGGGGDHGGSGRAGAGGGRGSGGRGGSDERGQRAAAAAAPVARASATEWQRWSSRAYGPSPAPSALTTGLFAFRGSVELQARV